MKYFHFRTLSLKQTVSISENIHKTLQKLCRRNCKYYRTKQKCFVILTVLFVLAVALNKPTTLSSEFDEFHKSSNAVDGNNMCTTPSSVAASQYSTHPWLLIQLETAYQVKMVKVFAQSDGYRML